MTEKRFVCYFDDIVKKWYVQNTDSLDMYPVADEAMGEEFAHLLNLYHQTLNNVEKENEWLKKELERCKCWINSDKYDYELTLAFIKNKGYSLKDVLEYEKGIK